MDTALKLVSNVQSMWRPLITSMFRILHWASPLDILSDGWLPSRNEVCLCSHATYDRNRSWYEFCTLYATANKMTSFMRNNETTILTVTTKIENICRHSTLLSRPEKDALITASNIHTQPCINRSVCFRNNTWQHADTQGPTFQLWICTTINGTSTAILAYFLGGEY